MALAIAPSRAMSNDLFDDVQAREPQFSEAIKEGRLLSEAWWARAGQSGMWKGKNFNAAVYGFHMKNRFAHWKDKQDVTLAADKDAPPVFTLKIDNT